MMDVAGLHCGGQGIYIGLSWWYGWLSQTIVGLRESGKREAEDSMNRKFFHGVSL